VEVASSFCLLEGSFKSVTLAPRTVREMTQLPKETQKNGDRQTNQKAQMNKQSKTGWSFKLIYEWPRETTY